MYVKTIHTKKFLFFVRNVMVFFWNHFLYFVHLCNRDVTFKLFRALRSLLHRGLQLHWPLGELSLFQITSHWPWTLQLTYDLGTFLNVEFSALSIADVKKVGLHLKNEVDLEKAMRVNFKVKIKVTIEFLVEIYFKNDLHFF